MRWPGRLDRRLLAVASGCFAGAVGLLLGHPGLMLGLGCGVIAGPLPMWVRSLLPIGLLVGGLSAGVGLVEQEALLGVDLPSGPVETEVYLLTDPVHGRYDSRAVVEDERGRPLLLTHAGIEAVAGEMVRVEGTLLAAPGTHRGRVHVGRLLASELVPVGSRPGFGVANALRDRVATALDPWDTPGAALVSGFLIGDISRLPDFHREALTAAGLSHFVAVSGSNVALALGLWWVVTAPFALSPRTRAITGLVGIGLFVLVTRWEPSVLRAGTMVGLLLLGRAVGVPLSGWGSLALAVIGLVVVTPFLVTSIGFQLSTMATIGLLAGSGLLEGRLPRWLAAPLGATVAAQVAVAPLLLLHFGTVPVFSPVANLVAGPIVALSTSLGGLGVLVGLPALTRLAVGLAGVVVWIAETAAGFPSVGWKGAVTLCILGASMRHARARVPALAVVLILAGVFAVPPRGEPSVIVFDVGQGDSILLTGAEGERILVDGGPDPGRLATRLRAHGVRRLDLIVISHRHADHVAGLSAVLGVIPVGEVWMVPHDEDGALAPILEAAAMASVPVVTPAVGERYAVGTVHLEVIGPRRRYASPNDASLVTIATINGWRVGLVGDIETFAQQDLGPIEVDVLKVPHQGGATSLDWWLEESAGQVSVISVGRNDFGHPATWVVETLERSGADVCRTDRDGDVVIVLDHSSDALSGC